MRDPDRPCVRNVAPGVRLHVLSTRRFATVSCRVVLARPLDRHATALAVLASVLQSASERHPTREALAWRLADLHGATLGLAASKCGDAQLLGASLEWPTAHVVREERALGDGLAFLGEVLARPKRSRPGGQALDPEVVATEVVNHRRSLRALADDKGRLAQRRLLELACPGEPYALDALGREEDLEAVSAAGLGVLHRRLLRTAPVEVFLAGDVGGPAALSAVRRHLLWPERDRHPRRPPRAAGARSPRAHPRRGRQVDAVTQARVGLAWRARLGPLSPWFPAALTLAGVLGGGSWGRLFKVVREEHGLCYDASAAWHPAKGLLTADLGVDPARVSRAVALTRRLVAEVAGGGLEPAALAGFRAAIASRVAALHDDRGALAAWTLDAALLGLDPSPEALRRRLEAVTPDDVRRVGRLLGAQASFVLTRRERTGR